jgi:hypothetical protein
LGGVFLVAFFGNIDDYEIISLKNSSATELAGVLTSLLIKNKRHSNFTIHNNTVRRLVSNQISMLRSQRA